VQTITVRETTTIEKTSVRMRKEFGQGNGRVGELGKTT